MGTKLAFVLTLLVASSAAAQVRPIEEAPRPASEGELREARLAARIGWGQELDVDGDGAAELFTANEQGEVSLFRGGTRQRLGTFGEPTDFELAALAQGGLAVVVVMVGSAHNVTYDYFAVRVTSAGARTVGSIAVHDAMQWVSLANLDADPEPEVVMIIAREGEISSAEVRVYDLRGDRMTPVPRSRALRRAFAAPARDAALRGRQPELQRVLSVYPEDWRVQLAHARRLIARERGEIAPPAMWALAHAPAARRPALAQELGEWAQWDSWPYGLVFESFSCTPTSRLTAAEPQMRWSIQSSCIRERRGR